MSTTPRFQIRREDGKWWSGSDWESEGRRAGTFTELPDRLPSKGSSSMANPEYAFREKGEKEWRYNGSLIARAIHIGG